MSAPLRTLDISSREYLQRLDALVDSVLDMPKQEALRTLHHEVGDGTPYFTARDVYQRKMARRKKALRT